MAIYVARQFEATITGAYSTNIQPYSEFQGVIINKELDNEIKKNNGRCQGIISTKRHSL